MKPADRFAYGFFLACLAAFFLVVLFAGCATTAAGVRRMAEAQLSSCRKGMVTGAQASSCYAETRAFCRSKGLERTCGEGWQR